MTVLPFGIISSLAILIQVVKRIVKSIENDNSRSLLWMILYYIIIHIYIHVEINQGNIAAHKQIPTHTHIIINWSIGL